MANVLIFLLKNVGSFCILYFSIKNVGIRKNCISEALLLCLHGENKKKYPYLLFEKNLTWNCVLISVYSIYFHCEIRKLFI